jgi:formylglycine-generating enzyme required for sulfatase activity
MNFSQKIKRFWLCAAVLLGARFSGAVDDYLVIDISAGNTENYPVAYYDTLPGSVTDDLYKTDKLVLKKITAGSFLMGSPVDEAGRPALNPNEDLHQVTLTEDFYIGVYEVTEYQWSKILLYDKVTKKPAVDTTVTMDHIKTLSESFIAKLNRGADLGAMAIDLPTEAQWEYACRAGTQSAYSFGSDAGQLGSYAWFDGNNGTPSLPKEVGTKNPNPWGLYDMHGNAAEFCRDAYNANLGTNAVTDPYYVSGTAERVERSGAYNRPAADNRSAFRNAVGNAGTYRTGFRISATIPPPPPLYELTVVNGSGGGSYTNGHVQTIVAEAAPQWFVFDQWTGMVATVANLYAPATTVTLAGADLSVGASYKPALYAVTVSNGTASAYSVTNAQVVTLWADIPSTETNVFWRWEGDIAGLADIYAMTTTLTVAGADVGVAAVYRHAPYTLTVSGGSGGGGYHFAGEVVAIQAPAPGAHQWFLWEGPAPFADAESWSTTLVMPAADTVVTATYPVRRYDLTVVGGTGSGSYTNGARVAVNTLAPPSALHQFERWAGDTNHLDNPLLPVSASSPCPVPMPLSTRSISRCRRSGANTWS